MSNTNTIILCGGGINYTSLPIGTNISNAMIPVNGKPVIGWILNDLIDKGIRQATVVLRAQDVHLRQFLARTYQARMQITIAALEQDGTILHSLLAGLRACPSDGLTRVILGDTLIRAPYKGDHDFVYMGEVEESRRWCVVSADANGRIVNLVDKQEREAEAPIMALAGYYQLAHGDHLTACVEACIAEDQRELSRALLLYHQTYPISAKLVDPSDWFDFGNIDRLVDARRRLLQPRHFNALLINPVLNTITKFSENDAKLRDELDWYLNIPDDLKVLTPRIVSRREVDGRLQFVQEYYGYPTLAELWVYGDLHTDTWMSILKQVLRIHGEFRRYAPPEPLDPVDALTMYRDKTWERIDQLANSSAYWRDLLDRETISVNGQTLRNLSALRDGINAAAGQLADSAPALACILHGDYCFSNILFDLNNQIIRLIDPRGSFGRKGIYGDPRYDIAKLRHSVHGLYDTITADLFEISETGAGVFETNIYANGVPSGVRPAFDRLISEQGYDLDEIKLIEGLLFVSMPPLHGDKFARQQIMYLTGIALLNEVI